MQNPANVQIFQKVTFLHDGRTLKCDADLKGDRKKIFEMLSIDLSTVRT